METRRPLVREVPILLALYLLPALSAPTGLTAVTTSARALIALTLRNGAFGLLVIYLGDLRGDREHLFGRRLSIRGTITTLCLVAAILVLTAFITTAIARIFPGTESGTYRIVSRLRAQYAPLVWLPLLTVAMVGVGFVEELVFRSYLLHRFSQLGLTAPRAVLLAAAIFGVGHVYQGGAATVFSCIAATALGYLWIRRGELLPFALGHALYNLGALLISYAVYNIF